MVINKFRILFICLRSSFRQRTRNNNGDLEVAISHSFQKQLLVQDNCTKNNLTIGKEKLQKKKKNENDLICDMKELCPSEPAAFLTTPPHATPISTASSVNCSSPSPSSSRTILASFSSKNNKVRDGAAETKP